METLAQGILHKKVEYFLVKIILIKNCVLSAFMIFFPFSRLQNSSSRPILWVECAFWSLCWRNGQLYRNFLWKPREFQRMLRKYILQRCRCTCKSKGNIHRIKWLGIHSFFVKIKYLFMFIFYLFNFSSTGGSNARIWRNHTWIDLGL